MSDLHQQIFVAEYAAQRAHGIEPDHAIKHAWRATELLADSAAEVAARALGRGVALDALRATVAKCERLLAQARAVMLGESELDEAGLAELLAEISSMIDDEEVER